MQSSHLSRRVLLHGAAIVPAAAWLAGPARYAAAQSSQQQPQQKEPEVSATEDLMREHGVLRRVLIVYDHAASVLRTDPAKLDVSALNAATVLFRDFGEDYHERALEEAIVFPALRGAGEVAALVDILTAQHERGREITAYVLATTGKGRVDAAALAPVLENMSQMYQAHTAWEDTVVFPAWKKALPQDQLDEMADRFEEIERQRFGQDGFDLGVRRIQEVQTALGIGDLAAFTAPAPPATPSGSP